MTTVENARVVNHVTMNGTSVQTETADNELIEATLKTEEEAKILEDDEEIHSCECEGQGHEITEKIENQMLTVALVNSVVDTSSPTSDKNAASASGSLPSRRPGARKRRRPSEALGDDVKQEANHVDDKGISQTTIQQQSDVHAVNVKQEPNNDVKLEVSKNVKIKTEIINEPPGDMPEPPGENHSIAGVDQVQPAQQQIAGVLSTSNATVKLEQPPSSTPLQHFQLSQAPNLPTAAPNHQPAYQVKQITTTSKAKRSDKTKPRPSRVSQKPATEIAAKDEPLVPTSGAVPNPLSMPLQSSSILLQQKAVETQPVADLAPPRETSVPCPLPTSVPCPLPPTSFEDKIETIPSEKKVTITEPPPMPTTRGRIFSVDLDPSTFDFPDISGIETDKTDNHDHSDPAAVPTSDLTIFQRDRAFSFEFFSFTGDDLLPSNLTTTSAAPAAETKDLPAPPVPVAEPPAPPPPPPVPTTRPRGDSIIFDPVSFQDGGIHEKNALLKGRAPSVDSATEGLIHSTRFATSTLTGPPETVVPPPKPTVSTPNPLPSYNVVVTSSSTTAPGQTATLPSALSTNSSNVTFQMELLNKDGRIGIYLPDARKARIARFHAKRKMRIWRKRIKYDCRKKLADSRPRIKGRFVKRSDMEED